MLSYQQNYGRTSRKNIENIPASYHVAKKTNTSTVKQKEERDQHDAY